ncbi:methyltransferase domain-containing protein [Roseovarius sp. SYSU LYC5161]|uniref:class I SAM-dependent methyltransferase n=1 Tax=Roseovarius halophilus (ex Wu et al. 2025) TaxID=3376060 RepID=UPI00399C0F51
MRDAPAKKNAAASPSDSTAVRAPSGSRNHVAPVYPGRVDDPSATRAIRHRLHWIASRVSGGRILDVGTGEGMLPVLLAREGFDVVGIDIDADAVARAGALLADEAETVRERVEFRNTSLFQDRFDPLFDTVVLGNVLEHVTNVPNFLHMACSHLRDEGRLVLTAPFGVQPEQDQIQSFFLSDIQQALGAHGHVEQLDVADGYIRAVMTKGAAGDSAGQDLVSPLLARTEQAAFEIQAALWQRLGADHDRLRQAEDARDSQQARADRAERAHADLQQEVQERLALFERREAELEGLKADLHQAETRSQALEDTTAQLRGELAAAQAELNAERHQQEGMSERLAEQTAQITAVQEENTVLTREVAAERAARETAETRLSTLRAAFLELEEENRRLTRQIDEAEFRQQDQGSTEKSA